MKTVAISFFSRYALMQVQEGRFKTEEEAFYYFKKKGVDYGDIFTTDLQKYPLTHYVKMMQNSGIQAGCLISFENIAETDARERERNIARVKEQLDNMEKNNIPMMMLAPSMEGCKCLSEYETKRELLIKGFSEVVDYAKTSGICITMENQSLLTRPDSRIEDVRLILDCVPGLKYVLDSGNFFCIGEDVCIAYEKFKDKLVHVHCKDWKWDLFGEFVRENMPRFHGCALGDGEVPLKRLIQILNEEKYSGNLVVEVNSAITWEKFDSCIDFLKGELTIKGAN